VHGPTYCKSGPNESKSRIECLTFLCSNVPSCRWYIAFRVDYLKKKISKPSFTRIVSRSITLQRNFNFHGMYTSI
jgi:hypothetical protein